MFSNRGRFRAENGRIYYEEGGPLETNNSNYLNGTNGGFTNWNIQNDVYDSGVAAMTQDYYNTPIDTRYGVMSNQQMPQLASTPKGVDTTPLPQSPMQDSQQQNGQQQNEQIGNSGGSNVNVGGIISTAANATANAIQNGGSNAEIAANAMGIPVLAKMWTANTAVTDQNIKNAQNYLNPSKFSYIQDASSRNGANVGLRQNMLNRPNTINTGMFKTSDNWKDFSSGRGSGTWWKNMATAQLQGAAAGSVGGPWGALGGATAGLIGSIAGLFGGKKRAKKEQERNNAIANAAISTGNYLNNKMQTEYNMANQNLITNGYASSKINDLAHISAYGGYINNKFDFGGAMNGTELPSNMQQYDAGGTHEENPYGGIQIGASDDGSVNLVEQGEFRVNDYIFSDRIEADPETLSSFNIKPSKHKKKGGNPTYADLGKKYAKKNRELINDPFTKRSNDAYFANLQKAQEYDKAKMAAEQQKQQQLDELRTALNKQYSNPLYNNMKYSGMGQNANAGLNENTEALSNPMDQSAITGYNRSGSPMLSAYGGELSPNLYSLENDKLNVQQMNAMNKQSSLGLGNSFNQKVSMFGDGGDIENPIDYVYDGGELPEITVDADSMPWYNKMWRKFDRNVLSYPKFAWNYFFPKKGEFIDFSDYNVSRVIDNDSGVDYLLTNDFNEVKNTNSTRQKKDYMNTSDTLIGDSKIPLSKIKTFYGVEDGKLKAGPLDIFDDETYVTPNRQAGTANGKIKEYIPGKKAGDNIPWYSWLPNGDAYKKRNEYSNAITNAGVHFLETHYPEEAQAVDKTLDSLYDNKSAWDKFLTSEERRKREKDLSKRSKSEINHRAEYEDYLKNSDEDAPRLYREAQKEWASLYTPKEINPKLITEHGDTLEVPMNSPKTLFADENGNAFFVSNPEEHKEEINNFLQETSLYPIMVDNGRYKYFMDNDDITTYTGNLFKPETNNVIGIKQKKALGGTLNNKFDEGGPIGIKPPDREVNLNGPIYSENPPIEDDTTPVVTPEMIEQSRYDAKYPNSLNSSGLTINGTTVRPGELSDWIDENAAFLNYLPYVGAIGDIDKFIADPTVANGIYAALNVIPYGKLLGKGVKALRAANRSNLVKELPLNQKIINAATKAGKSIGSSVLSELGEDALENLTELDPNENPNVFQRIYNYPLFGNNEITSNTGAKFHKVRTSSGTKWVDESGEFVLNEEEMANHLANGRAKFNAYGGNLYAAGGDVDPNSILDFEPEPYFDDWGEWLNGDYSILPRQNISLTNGVIKQPAPIIDKNPLLDKKDYVSFDYNNPDYLNWIKADNNYSNYKGKILDKSGNRIYGISNDNFGNSNDYLHNYFTDDQIAQIQRNYGLPVTGVVDKATTQAIQQSIGLKGKAIDGYFWDKSRKTLESQTPEYWTNIGPQGPISNVNGGTPVNNQTTPVNNQTTPVNNQTTPTTPVSSGNYNSVSVKGRAADPEFTGSLKEGDIVNSTNTGQSVSDTKPISKVGEYKELGSLPADSSGFQPFMLSEAGKYSNLGKGLVPNIMNWSGQANFNYDPVEKNALELGRLGSTSYKSMTDDNIGNYVAPHLMDVERLNNTAQAQTAANARNLLNLSNGNRGNAAASLVANNNNGEMSIGNNYSTADAYNADQRMKAAEFNKDTDKFNATANNQAYAQNLQAWLNGRNMDIQAQMAKNNELMRERHKDFDERRDAALNKQSDLAAMFDNQMDFWSGEARRNASLNKYNNLLNNRFYYDPKTGWHQKKDTGFNSRLNQHLNQQGLYGLTGDRRTQYEDYVSKNGYTLDEAADDFFENLAYAEKQARDEKDKERETQRLTTRNNNIAEARRLYRDLESIPDYEQWNTLKNGYNIDDWTNYSDEDVLTNLNGLRNLYNNYISRWQLPETAALATNYGTTQTPQTGSGNAYGGLLKRHKLKFS